MPGTPAPYALSFSFTAFEASNPSTPKPGASLDSNFGALAVSVNSLISALQDVRRADGALHDASVSLDTLDATVTSLLGGKFNPRGLWTTNTVYAKNDLVKAPDTLAGTYICGIGHTSSTWVNDKIAGLWLVLNVSDSGALFTGIPSPGSGDVGKYLVAAATGDPEWENLAATFTDVANGSAAAPSFAFANDATSGFFSPAVGAVALSIGGVLMTTWGAGGQIVHQGNLLTLDRDGSGNSTISSTPGIGLSTSIAFQFNSDTGGNVISSSLVTGLSAATLNGGVFKITAPATPAAETRIGVFNGIGRTVVSGGNSFYAWREDVASPLRWQLTYDSGSNELRFLPMSGYNMRFTAGTFFVGPQTGPLASSGGIQVWDAYVQNGLFFGQGGTGTFYISYLGLANLGATTVASLTVTGAALVGGKNVATSTGAVAPTGSVVEIGPFTSGSAATVDAGLGYVVIGMRSDGSGNFFVRTKLLAIS